MNLITAAEWARRNGHHEKTGALEIRRGKVPQAVKVGHQWLLPDDTPWPEDKRHMRYKKNIEKENKK
jgi:hypothetical protein